MQNLTNTDAATVPAPTAMTSPGASSRPERRPASRPGNQDASTPGSQPAPRPPFARDLASSATILAVASIAWIAWGSSTAPVGIAVAMWVSGLGAVAVTIAARRTRRIAPADSLHHGKALRSWWLWLGVEIVAILVGNAVLSMNGLWQYTICWTHLVMALHFIPLGRVYGIGLLNVSAALGTVIAVAGAVLMAVAGIPAGPVVGGLGALAMIGVGAMMVARANAVSRSADRTR